MALLQLFTNNAIALLNANISPTDMNIHVQPGLGALYPQPVNPGEFFLVTLETLTSPLTREIVQITGRTGDILHVGARAQEGTMAQAWTANETLVDHRITAETIRQAFLQPVYTPTGGSGGIITPSVPVAATTTQGVAMTGYSNTDRLNKFWVEMYDPVNGNAQALEVLAIITGLLNGSETVDYTQTHRIGHNFKGVIQITLDTLNRQVTLSWHNQEPVTNVIVTVTRI